MREKKNFGKKPVRRSKPEENEPARTYKPRTQRGGVPVKKKVDFSSPTESNEEFDNERRSTSSRPDWKKRSHSSSGSRDDDRRSGRRPATGRRGGEEGGKKYAPRTLRTKTTKGNESEEKFVPQKTKTSGAEEKGQGSYYEQKFGKPKVEKVIKLKEELVEKPKRERKLTPPEIDNELITDKDGLIRLNKYIANSGLCSRREADAFIEKGAITVNGLVVKELGSKVKLTDEVCHRGKQLDPEKKVYILLNKPKDYITTVDDPNAPRTVMELIEGACEQRVYPVGRLDRNSTGLLLFTNDGEITKRLTHPSFMKKKVYEVGLDKILKPEDMDAVRTGVDLEGEVIAADAIEYIDNSDLTKVGIEIHSGQNRVVRRIFEKLAYRVNKLDRVYFAGLTKKNLPRGKWRFLSQKEVDMLKSNRFE